MLKETCLYLQDSNLGGLRALLHRALFSHETQHFPCPPPGYKPEPCPEVPHILICSSASCQTCVHPSGRCSCGCELPSSRSSSLLQDQGYIVFSLTVVVQGSRCCVTLDHGGVQGGTHPKRVTSLYVLHRSRSLQLNSPSLTPSTSHKPVFGLAGPCTAPSALSLHPFLQSLWLLPHYRPHGIFLFTNLGRMVEKPPSLSDHPYLNAHPRTSYMTSYSTHPRMCDFCQFPHIFYLLSAAIFS